MHIVHGVISLDVGGLERLVADLTRSALTRGHRVTIVCLERPGTLAAGLVACGAAVLSLDKPPGRTPALVGRAVALFQEARPDILHTHQAGALWYLGQAARNYSMPVLHTEHGNPFSLATGPWRRLRARLFWHRAARYAARYCCVSGEIAAAVARWWTVPAAKIEVLPNGIDVNRFASEQGGDSVRAEMEVPHDAPVVGTVGRLTEVKRQGLLLQAVARLRSEFPTIHLLVVGDGPERQALEALAAALGIADCVRWAGYQPSPERYLAAMNVFALTSRSEGLPVSLLEAWAASRPVVCSAVGGIPGVVTHDQDGLLFPSGDVEALTAALRRLLRDPVTARKMGQAGLTVVRDRFSLDRMAAAYESRYSALVADVGR